MKLKCPLSLYGGCALDVEIVSFGENTKSAKRGNNKKYLKCPVHGSIRMDKAEAQEVIRQAIGEKMPVTEKPEKINLEKPEIPQPEPEKLTNKESKKLSEWGF